MIDTLAVVALLGTVMAMAMPSTASSLRAFRLKGDAQSVHNLVSLAKIRAAARYTRARVHVNLADNNYVLETWDRAEGTWVANDSSNTTSSGVTFGFADLDSPPPDTQPEIALSPACVDDDGAQIPQTACVTFNSRGVPVDGTGTPTGLNALYLTDGTGVYATTITATPLARFWWSPAVTAHWVNR